MDDEGFGLPRGQQGQLAVGCQAQQPGVLVGVAVQLARSVLAFGGPASRVMGVDAQRLASGGIGGGGRCPSFTKITAPSALCGAWPEPAGLRRYQPWG